MVTDAATVNANGQPTAELSLDETVWTTLVESVLEGECTPFLGAGVAWPHLPSGKSLATKLAREYEYPLKDRTNLPRVAQYLATVYDPQFAKRRVHAHIAGMQAKFRKSSGKEYPDNYRILANLGLPIYLTTNYDDFMACALEAANRIPQVESCRWNNRLHNELKGYPKDSPTAEQPLVFHLHGQLSNKGSLLVTEDDYIDFTVSLSQRAQGRDAIIPHWIRRALSVCLLRILVHMILRVQRAEPSVAPDGDSISIGETLHTRR